MFDTFRLPIRRLAAAVVGLVLLTAAKDPAGTTLQLLQDASSSEDAVLAAAGGDEKAQTYALLGLLRRGDACDPATIRKLHKKGAKLRAWTGVVDAAAQKKPVIPPAISVNNGMGFRFEPLEEPPDGLQGSPYWLALAACPSTEAADEILRLEPKAASIAGGMPTTSDPWLLDAMLRFLYASEAERASRGQRAVKGATDAVRGIDVHVTGQAYRPFIHSHAFNTLEHYLQRCLRDAPARAVCTGDAGVALVDAVLDGWDALRGLPTATPQDEGELGHLMGLAIRTGDPAFAALFLDRAGSLDVDVGIYQASWFGLNPLEAAELMQRQAVSPEAVVAWERLATDLREHGLKAAGPEAVDERLATAVERWNTWHKSEDQADHEWAMQEMQNNERAYQELRAARLRGEILQRCLDSGAASQACFEDPRRATEEQYAYEAEKARSAATRQAIQQATSALQTVFLSASSATSQSPTPGSSAEVVCGGMWASVGLSASPTGPPASMCNGDTECEASIDRYYERNPKCSRPRSTPVPPPAPRGPPGAVSQE